MKFAVIVEKDEDGYYVASVPELPGCHTQAKTLDELTDRIREAIELYWRLGRLGLLRVLNLLEYNS
ncbi:MAG: type II toxin-antitoxin system HicB family antitoxin [Candidatus Brockarchaeota archaeon]|nr:type II toxin-antitoxin system HicB family antitoxin [Candidatus Brockarchaeota archaeon]